MKSLIEVLIDQILKMHASQLTGRDLEDLVDDVCAYKPRYAQKAVRAHFADRLMDERTR